LNFLNNFFVFALLIQASSKINYHGFVKVMEITVWAHVPRNNHHSKNL
jgi:predicted transcriptional regulator of viral defense system